MTPVEAYIRQQAPKYGVDPDVAVRVALGEGGVKNPFRHGEGPAPRSQDPSLGKLENSYGPFQLYVSGNGAGLGDRALAAGIDPRSNWQGGIDYALNEISQKGWGQWYGAKAQGITGMQGVGGRPANAPAPQGGSPPVMDGPRGQEQIVPAGYSTRPQGPVEAAGGGYGSDPVNPAMQPPVAAGRNGLASVMPGQAGGPPEAPAAPAEPAATWWQNIAKNIGKLGGSTIATGAPARSGASPTPAAARIDQGEVPTIDPQQAEAQRQMLALAMQRLNSGRLF
jgi:hypothetical protein